LSKENNRIFLGLTGVYQSVIIILERVIFVRKISKRIAAMIAACVMVATTAAVSLSAAHIPGCGAQGQIVTCGASVGITGSYHTVVYPNGDTFTCHQSTLRRMHNP
jgi:hypothetical protein